MRLVLYRKSDWDYWRHSISPYVHSFFNDVILVIYGLYRSIDTLLHAGLITPLVARFSPSGELTA